MLEVLSDLDAYELRPGRGATFGQSFADEHRWVELRTFTAQNFACDHWMIAVEIRSKSTRCTTTTVQGFLNLTRKRRERDRIIGKRSSINSMCSLLDLLKTLNRSLNTLEDLKSFLTR